MIFLRGGVLEALTSKNSLSFATLGFADVAGVFCFPVFTFFDFGAASSSLLSLAMNPPSDS